MNFEKIKTKAGTLPEIESVENVEKCLECFSELLFGQLEHDEACVLRSNLWRLSTPPTDHALPVISLTFGVFTFSNYVLSWKLHFFLLASFLHAADHVQ